MNTENPMALKVQENYPLSKLTTFRIGGPARYLTYVSTFDELKEAMTFAKDKGVETFVLGGGSNMLVSDKGFDGMVIIVMIENFEVIEEDDESVVVRVASGELWDHVVERVVNKGWWGIENLSLIPGRAGAAVIQNIGAYGHEIRTTVESVQVYNRETGNIQSLQNKDCVFGYRESIFNTSSKGKYIILDIQLRLQKHGEPRTDYPDVEKYLAEHNITNPTLKQMRKAVVDIRTKKLPDPAKIGNTGSIFKNLYISHEEYEDLRKQVSKNFDEMTIAKLDEIKDRFLTEASVKIPAAFLVDICDLRGTQVGGAKVHENQVLVIVNETGKATANDVMMLIQKIRRTVYYKTGIELFPEPELVGFTKTELDDYFSLA